MWLSKLNVPERWREGKSDRTLFDAFMQISGIAYRDVSTRQTLAVTLGEESVFIKKHFGVGWFEIIKNILMGKIPVIDAGREWRMLRKVESIGIHAPKALALGICGINPAKRRSFIVMEALPDMVSLETLAVSRSPALTSSRKRRKLIKLLADTVRRLHCHGIYHRDLYLCHFLTPQTKSESIDALHLIDFHRAAYCRQVPKRWLVKDLASLYFSTWPVELSMRDKLYFIRVYSAKPLREAITERHRFWQAIDRRATKLYNEYMSKYGSDHEAYQLR